MAWGRSSGTGSAASDLVNKVTANKIDSLFVLKFRKFGDEEAVAVAKALKGNTAMREFYASGHALGNTGATAFGDMLASNSTLLRLCIGNAEFGDDGLSALCKGLKANSGLQQLDIEYKGLTPAAGAMLGEVLRVHNQLQTLLLARNLLRSEGVIAMLSADGYLGHTSAPLLTLDLTENEVGWEGLVAVSKAVASPSSQIRVLKLCENSGLETSSGVEGSEVHPDAAGGAGSEVIAALTTAASLREIWLDKCNVSANFLRHMSASLSATHLHTLKLNSNPAVADCVDTLAPALAAWPIQALHLQHCGLNDGHGPKLAKAMAACAGLRHLDVGHNALGAGFAREIAASPTLVSIRVFDNKLGDEGLQALASAVSEAAPCLSALATLDLGGNGVGMAGINALYSALSGGAMAALTVLELFGSDVDAEMEARTTTLAASRGIDIAWKSKRSPDDPVYAHATDGPAPGNAIMGAGAGAGAAGAGAGAGAM